MSMRFLGWMVTLAAAIGCSGKPSTPTYLPRSALLDPTTCRNCHVTHYTDWSGSMHAYASDDPVFRAMNARGQRETDGGLGNFCIRCHAPMADREGATTDGLNLDQVASSLHGVTCYFCHSVDAVNGTHNDPLHLASDNVMRGGISDPLANDAHASTYTPLTDRSQLASSTLCGSCHDIVTNHGAAIERTYSEWQASAYSKAPVGETCGQCHMNQSTSLVPVAAVTGAPARRYHGHGMPAIDSALVAGFPQTAEQQQLIQDFLGTSLQDAVCVVEEGGSSQIQVILDNVASGHGWPSGSTQDRRTWVEVEAYSGGRLIYSSGAVPDGGTPTDLATTDPDLWLLRDCMFDDTGAQVAMFWNAATVESNELPAQQTFSIADPRYYQSHIVQTYPGGTRTLGAAPDRVDVRVRLQAIGLDVLSDLVASGDLDAGIRDAMTTFDVPNTEVEWTAATATVNYVDSTTQLPVSCISLSGLNVQADKVAATRHADCSP